MRILSLDGGGILGYFEGYLLGKIAEKYAISDFSSEFDLIAGTSTGGIIALCLAAGKPVQEVNSLYKNHGSEIFGKPRRMFGLCRSKYSEASLKKYLYDTFGDMKLKDLKTPILIPAINISMGQPWIFKYGTSAEFTRDPGMTVVDVALSTSAAPTYFPKHQIPEHGTFVDGGIWHNNPALLALFEALTYMDQKEDIELLSIGNPISFISFRGNLNSVNSSLLHWGRELVTTGLKMTSIGDHNMLNIAKKRGSLGLSKYLRLPDFKNCNLGGLNTLSMDSVTDKNFSKMEELANNCFNYQREEIDNFFKGGTHG